MRARRPATIIGFFTVEAPKMNLSLSRLSILGQALLLALLLAAPASAATFGFTGQVTCPASGQAAQVFAPSLRATGWAVLNESGTDVRIAYVQSGTFGLNTGNSVLLKAGKALSDNEPGLYTGRIVCSSTTASAVAVDVIRNSK
jgi:hypothetical protein